MKKETLTAYRLSLVQHLFNVLNSTFSAGNWWKNDRSCFVKRISSKPLEYRKLFRISDNAIIAIIAYTTYFE
jgi:hypothetical protein